MVMTKESGIIELEVLTPLFIKGKDPDYGEGIYTIGEKAYLLDNDKICKFIYDKTYDENGGYLDSAKDYVAWFLEFMKPDKSNKAIIDLYNIFTRLAEPAKGLVGGLDEIPKVEKEGIKNKSLQYFFDKLRLLGRDKKAAIKDLSKGVTTLRSSGRKKRFIQNGRGEHFLPASSIKGAMRNALLWKMLGTNQSIYETFKDYVTINLSLSEQLDDRGKKEFAAKFSKHENHSGKSLDVITFSSYFPKFAGSPTSCAPEFIDDYNEQWENASDIHRDFFRFVKITDASFIEKPVCQYVNIETYNLNEQEFKKRDNTESEIEAATQGTKAWFRIAIDKELAKEFFRGDIPPYLQSIEAILQTVNEFFLAVAAEDLAFYEKATHPGPVHDVKKCYKALLEPVDAEQPETISLFRLGWGGGMMSKTQFLHLDEKDRKRSRNLMNDRGEKVAPQSRCLQVVGINAVRPLGWCKLRYLGSGMDEAEHVKAKADTEAEAVRQASAPAPPGCVRATIVDDQSQPVQVRIDEGDYQNSIINMTGMKLQQLQNLKLKKDSVVFVKPVVLRGGKGKSQLINVTYNRKP